MSTRSGSNTLVFAVTAACTIALDQVLKAIVSASIEPGRSVAVIPHVLSITNTTNTGAAFGLFRGSSHLVFLASLVIVVLLLTWLFWSRGRAGIWSFVGLGLIIGGAIGNLADRIFRGKVLDFMDLGWWPVFNIADIAIAAGVIIVLVGYARELWRMEGGRKP